MMFLNNLKQILMLYHTCLFALLELPSTQYKLVYLLVFSDFAFLSSFVVSDCQSNFKIKGSLSKYTKLSFSSDA